MNSPFCKGVCYNLERKQCHFCICFWKRNWKFTILKLMRFVCFVLLEKILRQGLQSSVNYKWLTRNSWSNKIKKIQIQTISETLLFGNFITNSKKRNKDYGLLYRYRKSSRWSAQAKKKIKNQNTAFFPKIKSRHYRFYE